MDETFISKYSLKNTPKALSAMPSGSLKSVRKELNISKDTANSLELNASPTSPECSPQHTGKQLGNLDLLASVTAPKKTLGSRARLNTVTPLLGARELVRTLSNASEKLMTAPPRKRLPPTSPSSPPGANTLKHSKNTEESLPRLATSKPKSLSSGDPLVQEKPDSPKSSLMEEMGPIGLLPTQRGLMIMKDKRQSYSMTSMAPSLTQPSFGCWIEPNFDWKAKGLTLTSWLKSFSLRLTNNQVSGTMALSIQWMPYDDASNTKSTSSIPNVPSSVVQPFLLSDSDGESTST